MNKIAEANEANVVDRANSANQADKASLAEANESLASEGIAVIIKYLSYKPIGAAPPRL